MSSSTCSCLGVLPHQPTIHSIPTHLRSFVRIPCPHVPCPTPISLCSSSRLLFYDQCWEQPLASIAFSLAFTAPVCRVLGYLGLSRGSSQSGLLLRSASATQRPVTCNSFAKMNDYTCISSPKAAENNPVYMLASNDLIVVFS